MEYIFGLIVLILLGSAHARIIDIFHKLYARQIDYTILIGKPSEEEKRPLRVLGKLVRYMQEQGYQPVGGPFEDSNGYWYQAMVKYESYSGQKKKEDAKTTYQRALAKQIVEDIRTDDTIIIKNHESN